MISQSGTALNPKLHSFMKRRLTEGSTWRMTEDFGCAKNTMSRILDCMQAVPARNLILKSGAVKTILEELKEEEEGWLAVCPISFHFIPCCCEKKKQSRFF